ncbi:VOC family protein [Actinomycetospora corticicola]|uniref:Catechol 2,3-dioxygenase-like lactoylglutathione lyase family enzyme n=1 Tax=Actinomycetospora corticicola TaxID=663602 RepID=A0A7Y9E1F2_9PSEU|nr:VOC family protein [Actinomycetospora corticicola]NYD39282.1 catechol 2,3-dioxygenase-like lactoylglutathione lyase family enzyme [Actinomycetospora corticicola]
MQPAPSAVGIVVSDMAASLAFYRALGLEVPDEPAPHVEIPFGGLRLLLDTEETVASFDPSFTPPTGNGRVGLALECGSPAEVDAAYERLVDAGYRGHLAPFDAFWGQRYAAVLDPDGVGVDLFAASS